MYLLTAGVLLIALLIGGAGFDHPLLGGTVEAASIVLFWYLAASGRLFSPPRGAAIPYAIAALALALPLVHLVPLSPSLWTLLPGRDLEIGILSAAGLPIGWRPLTVDALMTWSAALAVLPGVALFAATLHLRFERRVALLGIIVAVAIAAALLGALQRATGGDTFLNPFDTPHSGEAPGLFVNRNHQATLLLMSMPAAAVFGRATRSFGEIGQVERTVILVGTVLLLAAGVVATTSRMGFFLLAPALLSSLALLFPRLPSWRYWLPALALAGAVVYLGEQVSGVTLVLNRLDKHEDDRFLYWKDVEVAIPRYWPAGAGISTFERIYPTVEDLDNVGPNVVPHAHNDYLELALDGGAPAVCLVAGGLLFWVMAAISIARQPAGNRRLIGVGALAASAMPILHSIVDYPLRMAAVMAPFGVLAGILAREAAPRGRPVR